MYKKKFKKSVKKSNGLSKVQKYAIDKIVKSNIETKCVDTYTGAGAQLGTTATFADVTAVSQGSSSITRVGDQIELTRLSIRLFLDGQTTSNTIARLIYFQWRPDNATAPVIADILDLGPGGTANVFSHINYDNKHLFKLLKDVTYPMFPSVANPNNCREFEFDIPVSNLAKIRYDIAANTGDHHVYVMAISSTAAGATQLLWTHNARIRYKDA